MILPNVENAFIDLRKLTEYALSFDDARGQHKARVFKAALGITTENAEVLRKYIREAIAQEDAIKGEQDFYGQRYIVDCKIVTDVGEAMVRTGWIIRRDEDFPRLTTCYVLKK